METILRLDRKRITAKSTTGELFVDNQFQCFTLEDVVRDIKIPKETAIPAGRYQVVLSFSNRFQKFLPEVLNVPNYVGVRIHSGNRADDTEGCILTGTILGDDVVGNSRAAMGALMLKLQRATKAGKVWIEITNPAGPSMV